MEGFPQRTSTEETRGEREYVAAIDWRSAMRDSEKPFMRTVILSGRRWLRFGGTRSHLYGSEDFAAVTLKIRTARMKAVAAGDLIVAVLRLYSFSSSVVINN